eukprot:814307-Pelagomonas_calceolata.AAC.3
MACKALPNTERRNRLSCSCRIFNGAPAPSFERTSLAFTVVFLQRNFCTKLQWHFVNATPVPQSICFHHTAASMVATVNEASLASKGPSALLLTLHAGKQTMHCLIIDTREGPQPICLKFESALEYKANADPCLLHPIEFQELLPLESKANADLCSLHPSYPGGSYFYDPKQKAITASSKSTRSLPVGF